MGLPEDIALLNTKLTALTTRVTALESERDALKARVSTLETSSGTHALKTDLTALTGRVSTAETKLNALNPNLTARVVDLEDRVTANRSDIDAVVEEHEQRTAELVEWISAYEEGPIGNVPWPDRPVPPPISGKVAQKRQAARKRMGMRPDPGGPDETN